MRLYYCIFLSLSIIVDARHHRLDQDIIHELKSISTIEERLRMEKQILNAHNTYRKKHCVPEVVLDDELNRSAQTYADQMASTNIFEHSDQDVVGENLYMKSSSKEIKNFDGAFAVDGWYNEINLYDFKNPGFAEETGHFTQLVWKATTKIGIGYAYTKHEKRHKLYVVVHYAPPGNEDDAYEENVLRPRC